MTPAACADTCADILAQLARLGSPQTQRTYQRHGGRGVFGVSFADLGKLAARIKRNHPLAQALWHSAQPEARLLALMVADPALLTAAEAERWARELDWHALTGYLAALVGRSAHADAKMRDWMRDPAELVRESGYSLVAHRLKDDPAAIPDNELTRILGVIEREIHASPNRARAAMNGALIAIGIHKPALRDAALAAAGRIGKVQVDHGDTACKTPDAIPYIQKALARPPKRARAR